MVFHISLIYVHKISHSFFFLIFFIDFIFKLLYYLIFKGRCLCMENFSFSKTTKLYNKKEGYKVTVHSTCNDDTLVIPSSYNNIPVRELEYEDSYLSIKCQNIIIPSSIRYIKKHAFLHYENL